MQGLYHQQYVRALGGLVPHQRPLCVDYAHLQSQAGLLMEEWSETHLLAQRVLGTVMGDTSPNHNSNSAYRNTNYISTIYVLKNPKGALNPKPLKEPLKEPIAATLDPLGSSNDAGASPSPRAFSPAPHPQRLQMHA